MKKWRGVLAISVTVLMASLSLSFGDEPIDGRPYYKRTPLGIKIYWERGVKGQYLERWPDLFWRDIDWEKIDRVFLALHDYHVKAGHGAPITDLDLRIFIRKWEDPPPEYWGYPDRKVIPWCGIVPYCFAAQFGNDIRIHLGNDDGQGPDAFCHSALDHEMNHYILRKMNNHCSGLNDWGDRPECGGRIDITGEYVGYDPSAWYLNLCR